MDEEAPILTVEQIRMAKAALGWSNPTLAEKTGLHRNTINRAENGTATRGTLETLKVELEKAGVIFIAENGEGPGVRLRKRVRDLPKDQSVSSSVDENGE